MTLKLKKSDQNIQDFVGLIHEPTLIMPEKVIDENDEASKSVSGLSDETLSSSHTSFVDDQTTPVTVSHEKPKSNALPSLKDMLFNNNIEHDHDDLCNENKIKLNHNTETWVTTFERKISEDSVSYDVEIENYGVTPEEHEKYAVYFLDKLELLSKNSNNQLIDLDLSGLSVSKADLQKTIEKVLKDNSSKYTFINLLDTNSAFHQAVVTNTEDGLSNTHVLKSESESESEPEIRSFDFDDFSKVTKDEMIKLLDKEMKPDTKKIIIYKDTKDGQLKILLEKIIAEKYPNRDIKVVNDIPEAGHKLEFSKEFINLNQAEEFLKEMSWRINLKHKRAFERSLIKIESSDNTVKIYVDSSDNNFLVNEVKESCKNSLSQLGIYEDNSEASKKCTM
tara:strand:- start:25254 stop:26432 length:1179 start_codon:yes stop_codon:yes gene_type:complete